MFINFVVIKVNTENLLIHEISKWLGVCSLATHPNFPGYLSSKKQPCNPA
jgi:hypothetical protein